MSAPPPDSLAVIEEATGALERLYDKPNAAETRILAETRVALASLKREREEFENYRRDTEDWIARSTLEHARRAGLDGEQERKWPKTTTNETNPNTANPAGQSDVRPLDGEQEPNDA